MKLQVLPRLFTKPVDVKSFMKSNITVQEKQRRMKKEVKYDRMSCTTVKESHALFRLKKNHADLDAEEYADNLISYLDNARSIKSITLTDLNVLHGLTMTPFLKNDIENTNGFVVGKYIAAVWFEDTTYEWYLGVIEHINPSNTIVVSYLIRADTKGKTWVFLIKLNW